MPSVLRCTEVSRANDVKGQPRHFRHACATSGLPPTPDISRQRTNRRKGPQGDIDEARGEIPRAYSAVTSKPQKATTVAQMRQHARWVIRRILINTAYLIFIVPHS